MFSSSVQSVYAVKNLNKDMEKYFDAPKLLSASTAKLFSRLNSWYLVQIKL
jgi:hypothetical protein